MSTDISFANKLMQAFEAEGMERTFAKGAFILREGETEKHLHYVRQGAVRILYLTAHEEHTIRLGYDGSIINSLSSFYTRQPSEFSIEALRKSTIISLSKEKVVSLAEASEENKLQYRSLLEGMIVQLMEREVDLLTPSPAERLDRVLSRSPHVFQHIPLKYIASYLRMTPETLSRIRKS